MRSNSVSQFSAAVAIVICSSIFITKSATADIQIPSASTAAKLQAAYAPPADAITNVPEKFIILSNDLQVEGIGDDSGQLHCIKKDTHVRAWGIKDDPQNNYVKLVAPTTDCSDANKTLQPYLTYRVSATLLRSSGSSSQVSLGLVAIPFKYYIKGDNTVATNVSGAGYIGGTWHYDWLDANVTYALLAGIGNVQLPAATGGTTKSQLAFTWGFGIFGSGGDGTGTQFGIAIGEDVVPDGVRWVNNRKMWLAFQVGYKWQ